ncbi:MAG: hypothetical protein ACT4QB_05790 [Gammaproteobacteria bacterium]
MHKQLTSFNILALGGGLAGALLAAPVSGQMTSTAELKLACETSPGNVVALDVNTQISTGPRPPLAELVTTPCTIVLGPLVTFETGQVGMSFNGALTIQGGSEARALFIESAFVGHSVTSNLTGDLSTVQVERSLLQATDGDLALNVGPFGKVEIKGPLAGGNLLATGAISVSGGEKVAVVLADASVQAGTSLNLALSGPEAALTASTSTLTADGGAISVSSGLKSTSHLNDSQLQAATGLNVTMTGAEAAFVADKTVLNTANGTIAITSTGEQGVVELKLGSVATASGGLTVVLTGSESKLNANEFTLGGGTGNVALEADGDVGKVTLALGSISANGAVTVQAKTLGVAIVDTVEIDAGGDVRIETGGSGSTSAKQDNLASGTLVRIASGVGGFCESIGNVVTAPVQQICP